MRSVLSTSDELVLVRFGLAVGSFLWAVFLLLPHPLFPAGPYLQDGGRQTYYYMAAIAPESVWGMLFLLHSVWSGYALSSGVKNRVTLAIDGFLGCILWTASTAACFAAHWPMLPFVQALLSFQPPASISGGIVLSLFAWCRMVTLWSSEEFDKPRPRTIPRKA